MWFWALSSIAGSLLGAASTKYLKDTRLGIWLFMKVDQIASWAADKYDIDILDKEAVAWRTKYPNIARQIDSIDERLKALEDKSK